MVTPAPALASQETSIPLSVPEEFSTFAALLLGMRPSSALMALVTTSSLHRYLQQMRHQEAVAGQLILEGTFVDHGSRVAQIT